MTLKGLKDVIVARGAEPFLTDSIPQLKFSMNDRSQDVRVIFYEVLRHWMTKMEFQALRDHECSLIQMLLNGISDDSENVRNACMSFLEEHGSRMQ